MCHLNAKASNKQNNRQYLQKNKIIPNFLNFRLFLREKLLGKMYISALSKVNLNLRKLMNKF